jgi:hypothetical protein
MSRTGTSSSGRARGWQHSRRRQHKGERGRGGCGVLMCCHGMHTHKASSRYNERCDPDQGGQEDAAGAGSVRKESCQ